MPPHQRQCFTCRKWFTHTYVMSCAACPRNRVCKWCAAQMGGFPDVIESSEKGAATHSTYCSGKCAFYSGSKFVSCPKGCKGGVYSTSRYSTVCKVCKESFVPLNSDAVVTPDVTRANPYIPSTPAKPYIGPTPCLLAPTLVPADQFVPPAKCGIIGARRVCSVCKNNSTFHVLRCASPECRTSVCMPCQYDFLVVTDRDPDTQRPYIRLHCHAHQHEFEFIKCRTPGCRVLPSAPSNPPAVCPGCLAPIGRTVPGTRWLAPYRYIE